MKRYVYTNQDSKGKTHRPCEECGSTCFYDVVKDFTANHVCEEETRCAQCESPHLYWAYGNYDPYYGLPTIQEQREFDRYLFRRYLKRLILKPFVGMKRISERIFRPEKLNNNLPF